MTRIRTCAALASLLLAAAGSLPAGEATPPATPAAAIDPARLCGGWNVTGQARPFRRLDFYPNRTLLIAWDEDRREPRRYNVLDDKLYVLAADGRYLVFALRFAQRRLILADEDAGEEYVLTRISSQAGEPPDFAPVEVPPELAGSWLVTRYREEGEPPFRRLVLNADRTARLEGAPGFFNCEVWPAVILLRDPANGRLVDRLRYRTDGDYLLTLTSERWPGRFSLEREAPAATPGPSPAAGPTPAHPGSRRPPSPPADLLEQAREIQRRLGETTDPEERHALELQLHSLRKSLTLAQLAELEGRRPSPTAAPAGDPLQQARELQRRLRAATTDEERERLRRELAKANRLLTISQIEQLAGE